ncbi:MULTISPECIES: radical SAM protein [unclassified Carboxydocella]|uniref:radical SAM protein n=1 Tax=unclassified Carboxydocella TaxID=2685367 RepID=UPI0009AC690D|nr:MULTISPECIES: radical SAM protein [unclassified Carboxydocella]AVX30700.1 putative pyruvate formate lyase activating enzyme [Carboxydocella thermautotrophica]GAW30152.1 radical SAM protein [Carboxydocella sp. ULO1]GAW31105.1 radical SAM protein [Carboxydocella sp. JDF658]
MDIAPSYRQLHASGQLAERAEKAWAALASCHLCPRHCGVNRLEGQKGYCRSGARALVASYSPHFGEEEVLVGQGGSGTIFFSNCNLRCIFCQNCDISQADAGEEVSSSELAEIMLYLQKQGCVNINFVSPSHFVAPILEAVELAAARGLTIPLVYNSGGYDEVSALRLLAGVVDIYLPDLKFVSPAVSRRLADAKDYFAVARKAIKEMHRQVGDLEVDGQGLARRGLIVRHLVLPEDLAGTRAVVEFLAQEISPHTAINIMGQYYPAFQARQEPALRRRITGTELAQARQWALDLGLCLID